MNYNPTTTATCAVCHQPIIDRKFIRFSGIERGGNPELIHSYHLNLDRNDSATELVGAIPAHKEIITDLWVSVTPASLSNTAAFVAKMESRSGVCFDKNHGGNGKSIILHDAKHASLKAPIRFLNSTIPALAPKRINKLTVIFTAGKVSKTYSTASFRTDLKETPAEWLRYAEHDFCELIGCAEWSALKTGTRKSK